MVLVRNEKPALDLRNNRAHINVLLGNNIANPQWGTEYVPFVRAQMPATYYSGPIDPSNPTGPQTFPEDGIDRVYSSSHSYSNIPSHLLQLPCLRSAFSPIWA